MAPLGTVDALGWLSSTEAGTVSLVVFIILSIALVTLCAQCHRSSADMYEVSGATSQGAGGGNVAQPPDANESGNDRSSTWRNHRNMPPSTLERSMTANKHAGP